MTDKELKRLRKHGLAFDEMSEEDLLRSNYEDIQDMDVNLSGSGLYSLGSLLTGNGDTAFMIDLMKAQIRQQWVIVRQNEQIIRLLKEMSGGASEDSSKARGGAMLRIPTKVSEGAFVAMGDELVFRGTMLMKDGAIMQVGTPESIYNEPVNAYVADFIGESNIYDATVSGKKEVRFLGAKWECVDDFPINEKVDVVIRPEDVVEEHEYAEGRTLSETFPAEVTVYELLGSEAMIYADVEGGQVSAHLSAASPVRTGDKINCSVDVDKVHLFDKQTELAIAH